MASTTTKRRPRARRGEGDKLRSEILSAAQSLLLETGDEEAVSIRAVADAVGVTPPSIYLHFPDKEELLYAVCRKLFEELDELFQTEVSKSSSAVESLRIRGRAYVRFGLDHPDHYRVLFMQAPGNQPHHYTPDEVKASAAFGHLMNNVATLTADPRVRDDVEPYELALDCWAFVHGLTSLLITKPDFGWPDADDMLNGHFDRMLSGLLKR